MEIKAICLICGKDYIKRNGKTKYCSDECKAEATRRRQLAWKEEHKDYWKQWQSKNKGYVNEWLKDHPHYGRDRSRKKRGSVVIERECVICGKPFKSAYPQKQTCSTQCQRRLSYRRKNDNRLIGKVVDNDITLEKLFARDKGVCYLCGKTCDWNDRTAKRVGPNYPSIDHVFPLSKGGMHSWDNVKLAHLSCNIRKSNKVITEAV